MEDIKPISVINSSVWDAYFWVDDVNRWFLEFKKTPQSLPKSHLTKITAFGKVWLKI